MSHNTRTRADVTAWTSGVVTPAEFNKLDTQAFESINGDQGGVWAPLDQIEIGGEGLLVSGAFESTGGAEFSDSVLVNDDITINGVSTFNENLVALANVTVGNTTHDNFHVHAESLFFADAQFDGVVRATSNLIGEEDVTLGTAAGDNLHVHATGTFFSPCEFIDDVYMDATLHVQSNFAAIEDVTLGNASSDALHVHATSQFFADITAHEDLTVEGDFTVEGATDLQGDVTLGSTSGDAIDVPGTLTISQALGYGFHGRVPLRTAEGPDANESFDVKTTNVVWVSDLSDNRTYLMDLTDTVDGDFFIVSAAITSPSDVLTVAEDGGDTIFGIQGNGRVRVCYMYAKVAGTWRPVFRSDAGSNIDD